MSGRRPCTFTRAEIEALGLPARNDAGARLEDGMWRYRWRYCPMDDGGGDFTDGHDYREYSPIPDDGWELQPVDPVVVDLAIGMLGALSGHDIEALRRRLGYWLRQAGKLALAEVELRHELRATSPLDAVRATQGGT